MSGTTKNGRGNISTSGTEIELGSTGSNPVVLKRNPSQVGAEEVSLPATSTTLVGDDTPDVLTNKTISGNDNTITDLDPAAVLSADPADEHKVPVVQSDGSILLETLDNANIAAGANISLTKLAAGTASRAATFNASGVLEPSANVSTSELDYLDGVTSGIQGQLDGKQPTGNYITSLTGDVTASGPGAAAATIANSAVTTAKINDGAVTDAKIAAGVDAAKIGSGSVSNTEFGYLDGVTSGIQGQLGGKVSDTGDSMTGELTITLDQGGGSSTIEVFDALLHKRDTGVLSGGALSVNADPSKFDISAGEGNILDVSDVYYPVFTKVTWTAKTAQTVTNIATQPLTYVAINPDGSVFQQVTAPTMQERRQKIWLGRLGHSNGVSIGAVVSNPEVITATGNQLRDFMDAVGIFNRSGNVVSHNGANLQLSKTAGQIFVAGGNFQTNPENPNVVTTGALAPISFGLFKQNGIVATAQTAIIPSNYDNAGTVTVIGGSNNQATNFRVYQTASNNILVLYGQTVYSTLAAAIAGIKSESPVIPDTIRDVGLLIGIVSVTKGATALNDPAQAVFTASTKFGEAAASGQSVSTLQQAYNNGANGNIVLDSTRNGVRVADASTPLSAGTDLFSVTDSAGTTKYIEVDSQGIKGTGITASRALASDANGAVKSTAVTATELGFLSGVTSGIQAQIDAAGGSGSGEKNYVVNPSGKTNTAGWSNIGDLDIARTTTAAELPREFTTGTGFKITADANVQSTADYVYYDFSVDDIDLNKKLKIKWAQKPTGAYSAGQLAVVITSQADRTTALFTPSVSAIPAAEGVFETSFDTSSTVPLSLVIRATTDMTTDAGIVISDVVVGPGTIGQIPAVGNWESFVVSPSGMSDNTGSVEGFYRRVAESAEIRINFIKSATAGSGTATATFNLPPGLTPDTSKVGSIPTPIVGVAGTYSIEATTVYGIAQVGVTAGRLALLNQGGTTFYQGADFRASSQANIQVTIPIAEWAGSGTVNLGAGAQVEYASNSDVTSTASVTASGFQNNPAGQLFSNAWTIGTAYTRRVTFSSPIQNGDMVVVQHDNASGGTHWFDTALYYPYIRQGTNAYGVRISGQGTNYVDVEFAGGGPLANAATYATNGSAWTTQNAEGRRWRVIKARPDSPVGFGLATATESGISSGNLGWAGNATGSAVPAGKIGEIVAAGAVTTFQNRTATYADLASFSPSNPGVFRVTVSLYLFKNGATYSGDPDLGVGLSVTSGNSSTGLSAPVNFVNWSAPAASFNYTTLEISRQVRYTGSAFVFADGTSLSGSTLYLKNYHGSVSSGTPQYRYHYEIARVG